VGQELAGCGARLIANMVPTGRSPELDAATLRAMGFALAIWPAVCMAAACAAMEGALRHLAAAGTSAGSGVPMHSMAQAGARLTGFEEVWAFEKRWADPA
jgi:2-methylisocitrate lyase-like PEP mutase family enzyme